MAATPMAIIAILVASLVFQAALFGSEYAGDSFGKFEDLDQPCERRGAFGGEGGFFTAIMCFFDQTVQFFKVIGAIIGFFFKFIFFDIPGAPWYARAILSTLFTGGLLWSVATLFRGN